MKIISKIYYILITIISLNLSTINTFALPMGKFAKKSVDAVEYLKISVPHKGSIAVNNQINEKTCRDKNNRINRECYENKNKKNR